MKSEKEIIEEMAQVVEQMRLDDIEDNPDITDEYFDCDCCGKNKCKRKYTVYPFVSCGLVVTYVKPGYLRDEDGQKR